MTPLDSYRHARLLHSARAIDILRRIQAGDPVDEVRGQIAAVLDEDRRLTDELRALVYRSVPA